MVTKRISARDARANFSELLGQVYYTKEAVIVERRGKPFAVMVSPEEFERIEQIRARGLAVIDKLRELNADQNPEEIDRDVTATVGAVRQEMYEEAQRTTTKRRR